MLSQNIKALRTQKGLSQDELAARLHVVRQTVSKWEQGLSVPDADMLIALADVFEVPVGVLLGEKLPEADKSSELETIALKLEQLNALLAERNAQNRRLQRICAICLLVTAAVVGCGVLLPMLSFTLMLAAHENAASVGIIGGADGPTAIFVTGSPPSWGTILLIAALCIAAAVAAILLLKKAKKGS